ncbi:MAG: DUF975 family protein [Oscillospiraceae bacterium]|nr:DUF975 family protein [Oscillospiraceae bacterium]
MDIRNRRALKHNAAQALATAPGNPRRTVLIYVGASSLLSLLISAISMYLDSQIDKTGGLSNMGSRAILETIQSILPIISLVITLCWNLGYTEATLRMVRRQYTDHRTLLDGFRRFGPLLRNTLLQGLIYFFIMMGSVYVGSFLFMMTPLANEFVSLLMPLATDPVALQTAILTDESLQMAAMEAMLPLYPIVAVIFLLVAAPVFYLFRMVPCCLADQYGMGAIAAMRESSRMMRRNRINMFKLDLSFWWFYGIQLLTTVVAYGDVILPLLGVSLPFSSTVAYYVFYILSLAMQMIFYYFFLNKVEITYAAAYETLRPKPQPSQGVPLGNIFDLARNYHE